MFVYTIQPDRFDNGFDNRFDNRLYHVNGALTAQGRSTLTEQLLIIGMMESPCAVRKYSGRATTKELLGILE